MAPCLVLCSLWEATSQSSCLMFFFTSPSPAGNCWPAGLLPSHLLLCAQVQAQSPAPLCLWGVRKTKSLEWSLCTFERTPAVSLHIWHDNSYPFAHLKVREKISHSGDTQWEREKNFGSMLALLPVKFLLSRKFFKQIFANQKTI